MRLNRGNTQRSVAEENYVLNLSPYFFHMFEEEEQLGLEVAG